MRGKLIIGLTGTILSGKSEALKIFKKLGAFTISSDEIVRELQQKKSVQKEIIKIFNTTDKKVLAEQIFADPKKRKQLEALLHPKVMKEAGALAKKTKNKTIVFEVPLLFEAKLEKYFDVILCISADETTMAARIKKRNMSRRDFTARSAAQLSPREKMQRSDIVVFNNKTVKDLEVKLNKIFKLIRFTY